METNMVNNLELSTDQVLMKEIASGNQESMKRLVDKWKNVAFRFFNRSLKNEADAEDLTQQLFIKIYRSASSYKPKAKFSTFLFTVARNLLIDQIKVLLDLNQLCLLKNLLLFVYALQLFASYFLDLEYLVLLLKVCL